jgi:cysteine dioxygenase
MSSDSVTSLQELWQRIAVGFNGIQVPKCHATIVQTNESVGSTTSALTAANNPGTAPSANVTTSTLIGASPCTSLSVNSVLGGNEAILKYVGKLMAAYDATSGDWRGFAVSDEKRPYTRNMVYCDPGGRFCLMILCWNPGQSSPCHDHSGSECFMRLIEGSLIELRFQPSAKGPTLIGSEAMHPGITAFINDSIGLHAVSNPSKTERAVSLHLYIPPYKSCRAWVDGTNQPPQTCPLTFHH